VKFEQVEGNREDVSVGPTLRPEVGRFRGPPPMTAGRTGSASPRAWAGPAIFPSRGRSSTLSSSGSVELSVGGHEHGNRRRRSAVRSDLKAVPEDAE